MISKLKKLSLLTNEAFHESLAQNKELSMFLNDYLFKTNDWLINLTYNQSTPAGVKTVSPTTPTSSSLPTSASISPVGISSSATTQPTQQAVINQQSSSPKSYTQTTFQMPEQIKPLDQIKPLTANNTPPTQSNNSSTSTVNWEVKI